MEVRHGHWEGICVECHDIWSETWTLERQEKKRLEAAEVWLWRRVNGTSQMDRKSNEEVLKEINEKRTIL
jgi:hypothetical protein